MNQTRVNPSILIWLQPDCSQDKATAVERVLANHHIHFTTEKGFIVAHTDAVSFEALPPEARQYLQWQYQGHAPCGCNWTGQPPGTQELPRERCCKKHRP